jgi:enediyne biosynthesis protein E4
MRPFLFFSLFLFLLLSPSLPCGAGPYFTDVTQEAGIGGRNTFGGLDKAYAVESHGSGAAFFDGDGDGDLDLYIANGSTFAAMDTPGGVGNFYFCNQGDGTFADCTTKSGANDRGWGAGVAVGDVDSDGDADLFISNYGPNRLYRNRGDGRFVADAPLVGGALEASASAAFFDADNDGDLDLYVSNYFVFDPAAPDADDRCVYMGGLRVFCGPVGLPGAPDRLYRNDGGALVEVTGEAGIEAAATHYGLGVVPGDFDSDGDTDLFVANDETPNAFFDNRGDGTFAEVGIERGAAFNGDGEAESGMGVDAADYDNDGDLDLYVTNFYRESNTLYANDGAAFFHDATAAAGLVQPTLNLLGWGARFFDADADGDLDLFVANGHVYPQVDRSSSGGDYAQTNQFFVNKGDGTFADSSAGAGPGLGLKKVSRGTAVGDYDDDGDVDILVTNLDDTPDLLRNDSVAGHWLQVSLQGRGANREGIGTQLRLETEGGVQWRTAGGAAGYLGHNDVRVHFGLGEQTRARLELLWPDGGRQVLKDVPADRVLVVRQGEGFEAVKAKAGERGDRD